ncbi:hypothetical protein AB0M41_38395 [Streptomyces sp. NPDC051896]|uniref:hypothetical protein n=1 Tax=Streptomyces sp. NPDC051896 TaxID=3155416 RepID=UPI003420B3F3
MGRPTKAVTKVHGDTRWTIDTAYSGDTVAITAPTGGQATAVVTNALGQTTQRREYAGPTPTGTDFTTRCGCARVAKNFAAKRPCPDTRA